MNNTHPVVWIGPLLAVYLSPDAPAIARYRTRDRMRVAGRARAEDLRDALNALDWSELLEQLYPELPPHVREDRAIDMDGLLFARVSPPPRYPGEAVRYQYTLWEWTACGACVSHPLPEGVSPSAFLKEWTGIDYRAADPYDNPYL